ncbi:MAG: DUF4101 domain-containing protein [Limnothrix sp. RL_2_0]|nr:DUF4101 domain-containing protein [Limnothrix sp. RL_2_0]
MPVPPHPDPPFPKQPPPPKPVPDSQPTVVSAPAPNPQPVSVPTASVAPAAVVHSPRRGMADWQKAILTGGVIGVFLLGGVVLNDQLFGNNNNTTADIDNGGDETTEEEVSNVAGNDLPTIEDPPIEETIPPITPEPPVTPPITPPIPTEPALPINEFDAEAVVVKWLKCKSELFDYPYDVYCGELVLTGKAYDLNIKRSDGESSSVEWLQNNGSYYIFESQAIDEIRDFSMVGENQAVIELVVTESRTLHNAQDKVDKNASGYDQRLVRYNLRWADNTWKIADYDTLEVLWEE